jgi:hypothetical protein
LFNKEVHVDEHGVKRAMTIDFTKMSDRQLDFTIEAYGKGGQLAAQTAAIAERDRRKNTVKITGINAAIRSFLGV